MSKVIRTYLPYILLLLLSLLALWPLFHAGFFTMHDDTQVARVYEMGKMLRAGVFPVRWVPDLGYGYGYPIFNFYAPFAYYIGGLVMLLGFDALVATKVMIFISITASGIGMYLLAREFWGQKGGVLAGALYLYAPYHALNTYVRGDVAELYAYALMPFLFWGIWKLYESLAWKYAVITSIVYGLLIMSHNLSALMISPFFLMACISLYLVKRREKKSYRLFFLLLSPLFGILLASFYWMPVFSEMKYTNVVSQIGGNADFRNQFVCLSQLWSSPWMYGGSIPGCVDGLSFRIGKLHIVLSIIALVISLFFFRKNKRRGTSVLFAALVLISGVILMLDVSRPLWEAIPHMAFFQYPWRFLLLTSLASSFMGGSIPWYMQQYKPTRALTRITMLGIMLVLFLTSVKIFVPQRYLNKTAGDYTSDKALKEDTSLLSDEYLPPKFITPYPNIFFKERYLIRKGTAQLSNISEQPLMYSVRVTAKTPTELLIKLAYFPTWHIFINGEMKEFGYSNRGMVVTLPKGTYNISVRFKQTPIEIFANSVSIATLALLMFFVYYPKFNKKYGK
ncbi:6-pyruvoyl-tetrahydropterin synthase-related protein [soil metagenome]